MYSLMTKESTLLDDVDKGEAAGLFPGTASSRPAADPAALASDVAAYLSEGGGAEALLGATRRLFEMALASAADALSIVGAEGFLACVERRVTAGGTASGDLDAANAIALLTAASRSGSARVHARIAGDESLLRALLLAVARGPSDGARRGNAATALHQLSHTASWEAAARAVDALPDNDLKAVTLASVCGRWGTDFSLIVVAFLARCARSEAVLRRLLGPPVDFLRALAGLMGDEAAPDWLRPLAAKSIYGLVSAAKERGVGDKETFKPLLKPLMAAYERGNQPRASPAAISVGNNAGRALEILSRDAKLASSMAPDIPKLVAALRGGGPTAGSAASFLGGVGTQPALRASAVKAGAIPLLVALLRPDDRAVCSTALLALGNYAASVEGRAALRATDASARMTVLLSDDEMCRLSRGAAHLEGGDAGLLALTFATFELGNCFCTEILPASALIALATPARIAQIMRGEAAAAPAMHTLLNVAFIRRTSLDAMAASGALRAIFDAFVDAGASDRLLLLATVQLVIALEQGSAGLDDDIISSGPGVDRDCRQALSTLLLLPSNDVVLHRLRGLVDGDPVGASGERGECAAHAARRVLLALGVPGVAGPPPAQA